MEEQPDTRGYHLLYAGEPYRHVMANASPRNLTQGHSPDALWFSHHMQIVLMGSMSPPPLLLALASHLSPAKGSLIAREVLQCHSADGVGPFSLKPDGRAIWSSKLSALTCAVLCLGSEGSQEA